MGSKPRKPRRRVRPGDWLPAVEAAEVIGCNPSRLRQLIAAKAIKASERKRDGRRWLILGAAIRRIATSTSKVGWQRGKRRG